MIIRDDVTAETYCPLQFSIADLRRLKKEFRDHVPDVELDRCYTDAGEPFLIVTVPGADFDYAPPIIIRGERGWQMHRGGDGPLYEFATEREIAEFFIPRIEHRFGGWTLSARREEPRRDHLAHNYRRGLLETREEGGDFPASRKHRRTDLSLRFDTLDLGT